MQHLEWSKRERQVVRAAFERALAREAAALIQDVRDRVQSLNQLDDLWKLERFLHEKRRALDERYDFRYSVMLFVLVDLLRAGWLTLDELAGLEEDKRAYLAALLNMGEENAAAMDI